MDDLDVVQGHDGAHVRDHLIAVLREPLRVVRDLSVVLARRAVRNRVGAELPDASILDLAVSANREKRPQLARGGRGAE